MKIHCLFDELIDVKALKVHPKNRNKHSTDQIARLAQILDYQGWRHPIKISKLSGFITSGHGRRLAALTNEWKEVPVVYQHYENTDAEYADLISDNAIASWAKLDLSGINLDIPELSLPSIDLLGIEHFEIDPSERVMPIKTCPQCGFNPSEQEKNR